MSQSIYPQEIINFINGHIKTRPDVFRRKYPLKYNQIVNITQNLPDSLPLRQRYYHILNNIYDIPHCKTCNNAVAWNPSNHTYREYCSTKCLSNDLEVREKRKETCLTTYGGVAPACSNKVHEKSNQTKLKLYNDINFNNRPKAKDTCLREYSVENPSQLNVVKEQKKQTCLENHGVEYALQSLKIQEKVKQTCLGRYGVENPMQDEKIKWKTKHTNLIKYGTGCIFQSKNFKEKVKLTNMSKYGVEYTSQRHISPLSLELLDNKEYLTDQHHNKKNTLRAIAKNLSVDLSTVSDRFKTYNIEIKYFQFSMGEKEVLEYATLILPQGFEILANTRKIIPPYELDIYIPNLKIAIEYNGEYWHRDSEERDILKIDMCNKLNIKLMTIWENQWMNNRQLIKNVLQQELLI